MYIFSKLTVYSGTYYYNILSKFVPSFFCMSIALAKSVQPIYLLSKPEIDQIVNQKKACPTIDTLFSFCEEQMAGQFYYL